jgi:hypothetical protein
MPVIEVDDILDYQHNGRLHEYNILLLWSIFFAAVNVSSLLAALGSGSS